MADFTVYTTPLPKRSKPIMADFTVYTTPQLIDLLKERGHRPEWLKKCTRGKLIELANSGVVYTPDVPNVRSTEPAKPVSTGSGLSALMEAIAADIVPAVERSLLPKLTAIASRQPVETVLTVKLPSGETVKIDGLQHKIQPDVLTYALADVPVYLHGPAGSGKSTIAVVLAKQLAKVWNLDELPVRLQSFSAASQLHEIVGYADGHGRFHETPFYRAWKDGGVVLLDEFDASSEVMIAANAGLANNIMTFGNGETLPRHGHCRILAAGNTIMKGATVDYTGRSRIDAASIDRFAFLQVDYDENLERAAAGNDQHRWIDHVQRIRKTLIAMGASAPDLLVTPRASIMGARVLRAVPDTSWEKLEDALIWRGLDTAKVAQVKAAMR